jgi:hypothetical protein
MKSKRQDALKWIQGLVKAVLSGLILEAVKWLF